MERSVVLLGQQGEMREGKSCGKQKGRKEGREGGEGVREEVRRAAKDRRGEERRGHALMCGWGRQRP